MLRILILGATICTVYATADTPLMLNEDNSHFFMAWPKETMTREGLESWVDQYADTSVTHLYLNPNAMRASFASTVRDTIWDTGAQAPPAPGSWGERWIANARLLHERDLDPYAVWIAQARKKGISPWLSMRMNDVHEVPDPTNYMHSRFWVEHPEYRRVTENPQNWEDRALDFTHAEVRAFTMALVDELLNRYDADGLELDWMRFPYHFAPGKEVAGRAILTEFMRETRARATAAAEKWGHPVKIGARVPTHPDNAVGLGLDAVTWAKEGLIDVLVPTPFWASCDSDVPMELWCERLGDADKRVTLAGGIEHLTQAYPGAPQTAAGAEGMRGFAAMMLHRGAEAVYLFNYMDSGPEAAANADYHAMLKPSFDLGSLARLPRRHIVTYRDTVAPGASSNAQLPMVLDGPRDVTLHIGPAPQGGTAVARIGLAGDAGNAVPEIRVNGTPCTARTSDSDGSEVPGADAVVDADVAVTALHDGFNMIAMGEVTPASTVVWVELRLVPASE